MKALVLAPLAPVGLEELRASLSVVYESWTDIRSLYAPDELAQRLNDEQASVLVIEADFVFEEVFQEAPGLRFIGVCRAAVNHVDVEAATAHGVVVVNTPARTAQGVAELTLGLMISLARRITQAHRYVVDGGWQDLIDPYISMRGQELGGKALGIVGLGAIGERVAQLGSAFGMEVVAYDPYITEETAVPEGVTLLSLDDVVRSSDFLSLHAPGPEDGAPVIDASKLAKMKPGAFLINTAAPSLVDAPALAEALRMQRIAGAALDVHEAAPIQPGNPLLSLDNVVLTPHIGGATDGTLERYTSMMVSDILRFANGMRPQNLVNPQVYESYER